MDDIRDTIEKFWLRRMREPLSMTYLQCYVRSLGRAPVDMEVEQSEIYYPPEEDVGLWDVLDEVDPFEEAAARRREVEAAKKRHATLQEDARKCARLLETLRSQPTPDDVLLPSDAECAWMTPEERDLVEWFDRKEYAIFLVLSELFDIHAGWIVPYYRYCCIRFGLGCHRYSWGACGLPCEIAHVLDRISAAADEGNGRALNCLGVLHEFGYKATLEFGDPQPPRTLAKDLPLARDFYRRSAEAGCCLGMDNYARMLKYGQGGAADPEEAERLYRVLAERGLGRANYALVQLAAAKRGLDSFDLADFTDRLKRAADAGVVPAQAIVREAGTDPSPERLLAEYFILEAEEKAKRHQIENVSFSVIVPSSDRAETEKGDKAARDREWVAKSLPQGTVVPPPGGREEVRIPNLKSANPSFAARLILYVRDRFGGNAPRIYGAAHLSRKTYSSIIGNELRPVSKQTAVSLALALQLNHAEATAFIASAGFALSTFLTQDIVVDACIRAGIHDIDRVNEILDAHGAKTFPSSEDDSQPEDRQ